MTEPENNTDTPDAPEEKPSRTTPAIERAWVRWVEERDEAARDQLIVHYSPLVKFVAGRVAAGCRLRGGWGRGGDRLAGLRQRRGRRRVQGVVEEGALHGGSGHDASVSNDSGTLGYAANGAGGARAGILLPPREKVSANRRMRGLPIRRLTTHPTRFGGHLLPQGEKEADLLIRWRITGRAGRRVAVAQFEGARAMRLLDAADEHGFRP